MNISEPEIETVLKTAPRPVPPTGLKERLVASVRLPSPATALKPGREYMGPTGWLRRWWPVLVPAAASAACGVALMFQQVELESLKKSLADLPDPGTTVADPPPAAVTDTPVSENESPEQELARVQQAVAKLQREVSALEKLQAQNKELRARIAEAGAGTFAPEDLQALTEARERAARIACVNNLKQLGLAVRVWGVDNGEVTPPALLAMTNEMSTPRILVCPADTNRPVAKDWSTFTEANTSYKYLLPSVDYSEPEAVMLMCPLHGTICLIDGSVQVGVAKEHPELLQQRDGRLLYSPPPHPPTGAAPSRETQP